MSDTSEWAIETEGVEKNAVEALGELMNGGFADELARVAAQYKVMVSISFTPFEAEEAESE